MYELGCSTGALLRKDGLNATRDRARDPDRARGRAGDGGRGPAACSRTCGAWRCVTLTCFDAEFEPADLIVSYYTVQFIRPARRQALIDRVYQSLKWGGAFIMFEKVRAPDARFQDMMSLLYNDFKLDQGFQEHEIVHKSRSLKGVLEPFSSQGNHRYVATRWIPGPDDRLSSIYVLKAFSRSSNP